VKRAEIGHKKGMLYPSYGSAGCGERGRRNKEGKREERLKPARPRGFKGGNKGEARTGRTDTVAVLLSKGIAEGGGGSTKRGGTIRDAP